MSQESNTQNNAYELFANAPVPKAVFNNIIPSMVSMLMVLVYNIADTFFIGQTKNPLMVAAVSIATPAFMMFFSVGMALGIGGTSFISRKLGAKEETTAKHASSFCFWTGLVTGVICSILVFFNATNICRTIGASEDTLAYSCEYLQIVALCIPFLIISHTFSNIIRAEGAAKVAMAGMIIGNMVNIVLDPVFILFLGWNVSGAAIATVIGNISSTTFYIYHLLKRSKVLTISPKSYMVGNGIATGVLSIGIPAALNSILMSSSNILVNNLMANHGDMAVAGLGVAMKVNMMVVMILIGLGSGIQPILGYCFGAGNRKRYKEVLFFSMALAFAMSAIMTILCYTGAEFLVRIILDNDDAFVYGFSFSRIYIISGPIMGLLFVFINSIQALGAAIPGLILNISRQGIVYIPVLFITNAVFNTPTMLASAQPITDYFSLIMAGILLLITFKRKFPKEISSGNQ